MMLGSSRVTVAKILGDDADDTTREVAEESPVAIVHDGATYAVMMATPAGLEDFGVGLSFTEAVIGSAGDVKAVDVVPSETGIEIRMWLAPGLSASLLQWRRQLFGPTGCGLCGVESLEQATQTARRPQAELKGIKKGDIHAAMAALEPQQHLGRQTRAVHAAGLWLPDEGVVAVHEDVGRHNAVDKIAGTLLRQPMSPAGVLLLTSRVSVELVQKAAAIGIPFIAAVSAPTCLAIALAESLGITLVAVVRHDGFEVFTRRDRIADL